MSDDGILVELYAYDLTMGAARQLSPMFLGKQINAVWHTGVVIQGTEYFFGAGIHQAPAGTTPFGRPIRIENLGRTQVPKEVLDDMLADLGASKFRLDSYNLLFNNCNHFSNELTMLLTGTSIPDDILNQAQEVLNTPMGEMLMPLLMQMEMQMGSVTANQGMPPMGLNPFGLGMSPAAGFSPSFTPSPTSIPTFQPTPTPTPAATTTTTTTTTTTAVTRDTSTSTPVAQSTTTTSSIQSSTKRPSDTTDTVTSTSVSTASSQVVEPLSADAVTEGEQRGVAAGANDGGKDTDGGSVVKHPDAVDDVAASVGKVNLNADSRA